MTLENERPTDHIKSDPRAEPVPTPPSEQISPEKDDHAQLPAASLTCARPSPVCGPVAAPVKAGVTQRGSRRQGRRAAGAPVLMGQCFQFPVDVHRQGL